MIGKTSGYITVLVVAALGGAPSARANCAAPTSYQLAVTGSAVRVFLWNFKGRACPDPGGMLRENVSTGEVLKLADFCGPDAGPYTDECVPPGTYRYGLAHPYDCESASCGTYFYGTTTVSAPLGGCTRSQGDPGPTAASTVPWGTSELVCSRAGDGGTGGGPSGTGGGAEGGGGGVTGSGGGSAEVVDGGAGGGSGASAGNGCGALPGGAGVVLSVDTLALAVGAWFLRRSRHSRQ